MPDVETTTVSESGFASTSHAGGFEFRVDATGETAPTPNQQLVATYAACFLPAFRVGARQRGIDEIGRVQIDAEADLDDEDDLSGIAFHIAVEADLGDEREEILARAEDICHVHAALREGLHAEITLEDGVES